MRIRVSKQVFKKVLRPPARIAFITLSWVESKVSPEYRLRYSPTFIIGPPRIGSTLLYQLVTYALSTSYFTKLAIRLRVQGSPTIPVFAARLAKGFGLVKNHRERFESYYGNGQGWGGPDEGSQIWNQWFSRGYVGPGELCIKDQQEIYQAVAATERIFDRPFVNKDNFNSVRIRALAEIFPEALFIQCLRDPLATAQSIFVARTQDFPYRECKPDDPRIEWFSVKPKEYARIRDKGLIEQICEQVYSIEQNIAADRSVIGGEHFHPVHYRELCQHPRREIKKIADFMINHGAPTRIIRSIPASFNPSGKRKIDKASYLAMANCLERLYGQPMEVDNSGP
jgi:hypothetical protein